MPETLRLRCEPVADCARYDSLRRPDHGEIIRHCRSDQWRDMAHCWTRHAAGVPPARRAS